ncbi:MAG: EscU/YscU/HrcU family type III secretion system export apparatus switch protein [Deltaproteobacteria bacterium]|nr:EscU/YscU/HrcU family type III secretion system export apparatus switch protein [Deltaproteobacteria bacterium]
MSARTERPTPRRLREARRRGEVAVSRELTGAAALAGGLAALGGTGAATAGDLARLLRTSLAEAASGEPAALPALTRAAGAALRAAAPAMAAAVAAGALAGLLQTRFLLAPALAAPRLERLDLAAGLGRVASAQAWGTALLGLARALGVLAAGGWLALRALPALASLPRGSAGALPSAWSLRLWPAVLGLAGLLLFLGLADLLLARHRLQARLRMTRQEVMREQRDDEGEPLLRQERRRAQRALALAPPLARAAVLVVNPTHLAVAMAHDGRSESAPTVVAKGAGAAAARLRAEARRLGVPVVRNVGLARSLYRLAEVGDAVPEELYQAAAEVLVQLHRRAPEGAP